MPPEVRVHPNIRTVFGVVTEGQEVVDEIKQGDVMETIVVLQKRDHVYEVEKI